MRAQAQLSLIQAERAMDKSSQHGRVEAAEPDDARPARPRLAHGPDGDSLASIAFHHYRDPTRWRAIAEANGIDDPLHLKRGSVLSIPSIDE